MTQLHQKKRSMESMSDEYETPKELYEMLCSKYNFHPECDLCATDENSKCDGYIDKEMDVFNHRWKYSSDSFWCNPPHSMNGKFVELAHDLLLMGKETMMIIPANTMSSKYWHEYIEDTVEYHPIEGRIRFLVNGKPSKHMSRNAYVCVIWRKNG